MVTKILNLSGYMDLGSNTFQLLVASPWAPPPYQPAVIHREEQPVLLRKGLGAAGRPAPETTARARRVLDHYAALLRRYRVKDVHIVATEVFRTNDQTAVIIEYARKIQKSFFRIIPGDVEARLGAIAARHEFYDLSAFWSMDIGGGSTEFSFIEKGETAFAQSLPLGATHLTFQFAGLSSAPIAPTLQAAVRRRLRREWRAFPRHKGFPLVGLGGFFQTLAALAGTSVLTPKQVRAWHRRMMQHPASWWADKPVPAFRVPLLPVSSLLTTTFMEWANSDALYCGSWSLKEGLWIARTLDPAFFQSIFQ